MCSKSDFLELLNSNNKNNYPRSANIKKLLDFAITDNNFEISKKDITGFARNKFLPHLYDIEQQKEIIKNGILKGHSWHQAAPSRLHLTLQRWVRSFLKKEITFKEFMNRVHDVAKQEIYMLIGANITEYLIVNAHKDIIPNLKQRGISDVIINDLAYDVKNTHNPNTCPHNLRENPILIQEWLFDSGDLQRDLRTASKAPAHLGYNRIYVIIDPVEKWETELDYICNHIQEKIRKIKNQAIKPHIFTRKKDSRTITVHTHLITP